LAMLRKTVGLETPSIASKFGGHSWNFINSFLVNM
jgi:hypothetical protein